MRSSGGTNSLIRRAFTVTIPVMCGYLFMGTAFGLLLQDAGYNFIWAFFMSVVIYAGTMQYMAIPFLVAQTDLITVAITTFLVHFRHLVYGLSFLRRFQPMGWRKHYMTFALTDETYALMCTRYDIDRADEKKFLFFIALLDHIYWITGCTLGALAGQFLTINTKGIDFAMTALFIVIFVEQWRAAKSKLPALIGFGAAVLSLIITKLMEIDNMLIPSIIVIVLCLAGLRKRLEPMLVEEVGEKEDI